MKTYKVFLITIITCELLLNVCLIIRIGLLQVAFIYILVAIVGFMKMRKARSGIQERIMNDIIKMQQLGSELIDRACILLGCLLHVFPGFISGVIALFVMFQPTRNVVKPFILGLLYKLGEKSDSFLKMKKHGGGFSS